MARLLAIVWFAFKAWMFYDAVRRKAEDRWYWMIPFVPGGAIYYFFAVKLRDPGVAMMKQRMLEGLKRPPSVEELEQQFERTPSIANRVMLGQGLHDAGRFDEALGHFEQVLEERAGDKDALYGVGLCKLELKDAAGAVPPLTELVEDHRTYRDYAAWPELAEALWYSDKKEECHELLSDLVRMAPRLKHYVHQAHYLRKGGRLDEAKKVLKNAMAEEKHQPRHIQRINRPWMREAGELLREMA
jgi:hypothetical protein